MGFIVVGVGVSPRSLPIVRLVLSLLCGHGVRAQVYSRLFGTETEVGYWLASIVRSRSWVPWGF